MSSSFACVLIGRGPQLVACGEQLLRAGHRVLRVASDCPVAIGWTQRHGIAVTPTDADLQEALQGEPFDWLFSIVNHAITPAAVLALPRRGAINYHDSLLPDYGGFHATAWAILDGRTEHGITWHRMTAAVDAGPYLLQKTFPITEQDTAFALAARAGELATRAFGELLPQLALGTQVEQAPQPVRHFHRKSERPGFAGLDWSRPADELMRFVRAVDFGTEDHWFVRAKLLVPSGEFLCVGGVSALPAEPGRPGTVLRTTPAGVVVQAVDATLLLTELTSLEGIAVDAARLQALGVVAGAELPRAAQPFVQATEQLDRAVAGAERFWLRRLQTQAVPQLPELQVSAPAAALSTVAVPLPANVLTQAPAEQRAMLLAALAIYTSRVNDGARRVDLPVAVDAVTTELARLHAPAVPLTFAIEPGTPWQQVVQQAHAELQATATRGTFARDLWTRYQTLRTATGERQTPFAVGFAAAAPTALPAGLRLLLRLAPGARELVLHFDRGAIGPLHAERLLQRLVTLLANAQPATAAAAIDLVPAAERTLLLQTFQDTACEVADPLCIHDAFAAQVRLTPDRTAVVFRDASLTYRELGARVDALAAHLRQLGVGPDRLVAISIERSLDMVTGLLAILQAGGAYVPLDPAYPPDRLAMMLEDSGARWLLTQRHLRAQLPAPGATVVTIDEPLPTVASPAANGPVAAPHHLAYVIFTSGSTGRPKGVLVEHRNVANFFAGMDARLGREPGTWLAVTSISFDISVLELFWTLTRGFEVVIQEEADKASLLRANAQPVASARPMGFGLFYFSADSTDAHKKNAYRLLLDGARFADSHDFTAVWTPERHFHAFGGLYPNAAVTSAAIASITCRVELRAGSVVIPLHDPIRVAEEWAVVDNLSGGRVGLSFASGWHVNDFVLQPANYEARREVMFESIRTVLRLWAGEKIKRRNGQGQEVEVSVLPRPVRERPPMWIASAGNVETFRQAGREGWNILTNMLGQDLADLTTKFAAYRQARRESGHPGEGIISVILHTFVTDSDERARQVARGPFGNYLTTSYDLVKVAPWMFPAFKQPSVADAGGGSAFDPDRFDAADMEALLDHAFDRYFDTAGLFGTPQRALALIEKLKDAGATEVACLVDFGIDPEVVLQNLVHLDELRRLANPAPGQAAAAPRAIGVPVSIREQFERRRITHFQCTPSMARILLADGTLATMGSLRRFLIGGEALPAELATAITTALPQATLVNMYGPTETTVWSTTATIAAGTAPDITIGRAIANTRIRILDAQLGLLPLGVPGELCIGGHGVVRGYLHRPELTAERFVADPWQPGERLYRTGDLARFRDDGAIEYLGRLDQQVKVNGYRIELGEIEAVLRRHPIVEQAVVAAKTWNGATQLVAYVVPAGSSDSGSSTVAGTAATAYWQARWDTAYQNRVGAADAPARRDTSGWLSSCTGEPIATAAMQEWLEQTLLAIRARRPARVLEIGCGTGMLLYGLLDHVEHYTAVDQSPAALAAIRRELRPAEQRKVTLLELAAHQLQAVPDRSCDLVVINSVAQYFPNADYLVQVLQQAARVLTAGGSLFLGDVRCLEPSRAFHTLVELHQAPGRTAASALGPRITERQALDSELLLARHFFAELSARVPELQFVSMQCKRGGHATEMRDFRADVVLQKGAGLPALELAAVPVLEAPASLDAVRTALRTSPPLLRLAGLRNARLDRLAVAMATIAAGANDATAESLLAMLQQPAAGIDPDALRDLHPDYDVELRFGDDHAGLDALLRHRRTAPAGVWLPTPRTGAPAASTPYVRAGGESLAPKLRAHLRELLPEFMVPASFVPLAKFPLTPNGKIDRKALPLPVETTRASSEPVAPANALERTIAAIWQDLLGLDRVGRKDNLFDLGASSLLTVEANSRLQQDLGQKIPLVTMFRYPTIESLAGHLAKSVVTTSAPVGGTAVVDAETERQNRLAAAAERRRQARARNS
jgi:natural product biosynthesis luciferase-like monooxygenase protein